MPQTFPAACLIACLVVGGSLRSHAQDIHGIDMDILRQQAAAELKLPYPYTVDPAALARETATYHAGREAEAKRLTAAYEPLDSPEAYATKRNYRYPIPAATRTIDEHRAAVMKQATAVADADYSDRRLEALVQKVQEDWQTWKHGERATFEIPTAPYRVDGIFYGIKGEYYIFGDLQVLKEDIPTEILIRFDAARMERFRERRAATITADYKAQRAALLQRTLSPLIIQSLKDDNYVEATPGEWVPLAEIYLAMYADYVADHNRQRDSYVAKGLAQYAKVTSARLAPLGLTLSADGEQVLDRTIDFQRRVTALYEQAAVYHIDAARPADRAALAKAFVDAQPHPELAPGDLARKHRALLAP